MKIEFRLINSDEMPPMVISENEDGNPKVTINSHHRLWISLHRRTIAGVIEALQGKMDEILHAYLEEQHNLEKMDREMA